MQHDDLIRNGESQDCPPKDYLHLVPECYDFRELRGNTEPAVKPEPSSFARSLIMAGVKALGLFVDSYNLFVLSIIIKLFSSIYGERFDGSVFPVIMPSASVAGAVAGMLVIGMLLDLFGRRFGLILTSLLLAAGALVSGLAFGPDLTTVLVVFMIGRLISGIGIGGEYPACASFTAETAHLNTRGRSVGFVFAMQGWGLLTAAVLGLLVVYTACAGRTLCSDSALTVGWHVLVFVPLPLVVLVLVLRLMYLPKEALETKELNGRPLMPYPQRLQVLRRHYKTRLLGTMGSWLIFDIVFYGNLLFFNYIIADLLSSAAQADNPAHVLSTTYLVSAGIALVVVPSYYIAAVTVDRVGRRAMQLFGFGAMTVLFLVTGLVLRYTHAPSYVLLGLYALTFVPSNIGPNLTTFLVAAESYPTPIRSTCHGLSAAAGKIGASVGGVLFGLFVSHNILSTVQVFYVCALLSSCGFLLTVLTIKDMSCRDIDTIEGTRFVVGDSSISSTSSSSSCQTQVRLHPEAQAG